MSNKIIYIFMTFALGGSVTFGSMKLESPIQPYLLKALGGSTLLTTSINLESYHPMVVIEIAHDSDNGKVTTKILAASSSAPHIYGKFGEKSLIGLTSKQEETVLKQYVNDYDWNEFQVDQALVIAAYLDERAAIASVPIKFSTHQHSELNGKSYLPMIVSLAKKKIDGAVTTQRLSVVYFDLSIYTPLAIAATGTP